jgi:Tol biopolymer transport system component
MTITMTALIGLTLGLAAESAWWDRFMRHGRHFRQRKRTMFTHKHPRRSLAGVSVTLALLLAGAGQAVAQFCYGEPENLGPVVNSSVFDGGPTISADGLTLFFASARSGGSGFSDLWMTTRASEFDPWELPVNLGPTVNSSSEEWAPSISTDGLTLFFCSDRSGGSGANDLWMTTRASEFDPWELPVNLGPTVNSSSDDGGPSISADGLTLFFGSGRAGGFGGTDLWMTTRASEFDPWELPVNLGPTVNSSSDDGTPSISADGLTLSFNSKRPGGFGDRDLWVTTRASLADAWDPSVLVPPPVNTSSNDSTPSISADGRTLFFRSNRPGGEGGSDLWQVAITPTCPGDVDCDDDVDAADLLTMLAAWGDCPFDCPWDFNGDGVVDGLDEDILMEHWGDCPEPPEECPWDLNGDGVVDYQDLTELQEHFGPCPLEECPTDLDGDGDTDTADLLILLGAWGPCA